jgi:hypothetical protein
MEQQVLFMLFDLFLNRISTNDNLVPIHRNYRLFTQNPIEIQLSSLAVRIVFIRLRAAINCLFRVFKMNLMSIKVSFEMQELKVFV